VQPRGVLLDGSGNLYITDSGQHRIRKVAPGGVITTIAGNGTCCYSGDGGPAAFAQLNVPWGLALDAAGNLYVADSANNAIRQVAPGASGSFILRVTNAASGVLSGPAGGVSNGEIVAIYGAGLGSAQPTQFQLDSNGLVTTQLGGTRVLFNGAPGPVLYASAGQVTAIVPYNITGAGIQIAVQYQGQTTSAVTVPLLPAAPALFTVDGSGSGQARAVNLDGSTNDAAHPAPQGTYILLYSTGEGRTSPTGVDGSLDGVDPPQPVLPVSVTIGGQEANIVYAGGVSGEVAGLMQIRAQVPSGITPGSAVPVRLQVGTAVSPAGVTVSVGQ